MGEESKPGFMAGPEKQSTAQRFPPDVVSRHVTALFAAHGLSKSDAQIAAEALVEADLRGLWSHGVVRTPMYCARLSRGVAKSAPNITVTHIAPAASLVDGDDGLGLIVAPRAVDEALALAGECGVGLVGVKRSGHFGAAGRYVRRATKAGCLCWLYTTASPALPPHGGRTPHFGTSPLAFAAPTPEGTPPFVIDMAMSTVARGKLKYAARRGEPIPEGLALDRDGHPTTDGTEAFSGVMLPFGGMKGAVLSWMMDVVAGVFTGAAYGGEVSNPFTGLDRPQNVGHLVIAARADLFMPGADFARRMSEGISAAKSVPLAGGFVEILSPGEPEARNADVNAAKGIPLTTDVLKELGALAESVGVPRLVPGAN